MCNDNTMYAGCQYCWINGRKVGKEATLFRGYAQPILCVKGHLKGQLVQMGVNDESRHVTHEQQLQRAELAEMWKQVNPDTFDPGQIGVSSVSIFHKYLPYLDYNSFFLVPLSHALLFGVVKDFTKVIFRRSGCAGSAKDFLIPNAAINAMVSHETTFVLTQDFGRGYVSQVRRSGRYASTFHGCCPTQQCTLQLCHGALVQMGGGVLSFLICTYVIR